MLNKKTPLLVVVSAPSGAGKSTLCDMLMERDSNITYSVSCTTRAPRGEEKNRADYHFLSADEFAQRLATGEFLEHAQVHGYQYGTLRQTVYDALAEGRDIIMDIDVQGAAQIRAACAALPDEDSIKKGFTDIFIAPPSMEELRRRLCGRSTDADNVIEERLRNAAKEMKQQSCYQHVVINDDLEKAARELAAIILREHKNRV